MGGGRRRYGMWEVLRTTEETLGREWYLLPEEDKGQSKRVRQPATRAWALTATWSVWT